MHSSASNNLRSASGFGDVLAGKENGPKSPVQSEGEPAHCKVVLLTRECIRTAHQAMPLNPLPGRSHRNELS